jgi:hypothetical protein
LSGARQANLGKANRQIKPVDWTNEEANLTKSVVKDVRCGATI